MRTIASVLVFGVLVSVPLAARAQTPVLVDREAFLRKVEGLSSQVAELERQAWATPPSYGMAARPNNAASQMQYGLKALSDQLAALQKDLRGLPAFDYASNPPPPDDRNRDWNRDRERERDHDRDRDRIVIIAPPPPVAPLPPPVIDNENFDGVIDAIDDQSFSQDKLRVLEDAASTHWFRVDQVTRILDQFPFSNDKIRALELCAPRLVDRQNTFKIYNSFTFGNDKARARKILGQ